MTRLLSCYAICLVVLFCGALAKPASAAEGGASSYFPGAFGAFAHGMKPPLGWTFAGDTLGFKAEADRAALQGRINANLETIAIVENFVGPYSFEHAGLRRRSRTTRRSRTVRRTRFSAR